MSRILIITTSLRAKSNSDLLAEQAAAGAKAAGHQVECISLKGKTIGFCRGCLACHTSKSVIAGSRRNMQIPSHLLSREIRRLLNCWQSMTAG